MTAPQPAPQQPSTNAVPTDNSTLQHDRHARHGLAEPVPGVDWPTHGGYLGCLLGLLMSCIVAGFLGSTFFAAIRFYHLLPDVVAVVLSGATMFTIVLVCGRLGFVLGKRFLRSYQQAGKTWGQDDDYEYPENIETDVDSRGPAAPTGGGVPSSEQAPARDGDMNG